MARRGGLFDKRATRWIICPCCRPPFAWAVSKGGNGRRPIWVATCGHWIERG